MTPTENSAFDAVGSVCSARVNKDGRVELKRINHGKTGSNTPFNVLLLGTTKGGNLRLLTNVTGRKEPSWIVDVPPNMILMPGANTLAVSYDENRDIAVCTSDCTREQRGQERKGDRSTDDASHAQRKKTKIQGIR